MKALKNLPYKALIPRLKDCTSRQQELVGVTEEPAWKFDATSGTFKRNSSGEVAADTTSDLKWKLCQDFRGLAYDQAAVLSHSIHSRWITTLVQHKHRVPPPGYSPVTWQQLHNADCEIFMLAAQAARSGIRPNLAGVKPLDKIFEQLMTDSRVTFFLMPHSAGNARTAGAADSPVASGNHSQHKRAKTAHHQQQQQPRRQLPPDNQGKGKGKAQKGSKKGSNKGNQQRLTDGTLTHTRTGKALCVDWNSSSGCQAGASSMGLAQCTKGVHLCNAPKCQSRATHGRANHGQHHE